MSFAPANRGTSKVDCSAEGTRAYCSIAVNFVDFALSSGKGFNTKSSY